MKNTRITVRLTWNDKPQFYMHQNATDFKQYKIDVMEAFLHVTTFTPSMELKRELYPRISKKENAEPVFYHYPEMVVLSESIFKVSSYLSQNFVKDGGVSPTKIFVAFVKTENYVGSRKKCPFDFRRYHTHTDKCTHVYTR